MFSNEDCDLRSGKDFCLGGLLLNQKTKEGERSSLSSAGCKLFPQSNSLAINAGPVPGSCSVPP